MRFDKSSIDFVRGSRVLAQWPVTLVHMTLPGLGGLSNDDRNAKADPLNLSHVTKRYLKTKLQIT